MKASRAALVSALTLSGPLLAGACVPAPDSTPAPETVEVAAEPSPAPQPSAMPPAAPIVTLSEAERDWADRPRTAGNWQYLRTPMGTKAVFLTPGSRPLFTISCNTARNAVDIMRHEATLETAPLRILTEATERVATAEMSPSLPDRLSVSFASDDPLLDAMALTRGRFAVETPDSPTLYLPAWAEVTRVIEDCR